VDTINANELVELTVPSALGIRIPFVGIRLTPLAGQAFLIRTDTIGGAVPWTNLQKWHAIGSFTNTTSITFDPARGGSQSHIGISFVPQMMLELNDTINISLPRFAGSDFDLRAERNDSLLLTCVKSNIYGLLKRVTFSGPRVFEQVVEVIETRNVTEERNITVLENVTTEVICPSNKTFDYNITVRKNVT
jgi:hypothetical protein